MEYVQANTRTTPPKTRRVDYDKLLADRLAKPVPEDTLSPEHNDSRLHKSDADMGPADVREYCKLGNAFICCWL